VSTTLGATNSQQSPLAKLVAVIENVAMFDVDTEIVPMLEGVPLHTAPPAGIR
jgi:hypothetical protein